MKMRGDKCHPGRGKITLLPNNVGKKSVNDAGQNRVTTFVILMFPPIECPVFKYKLYYKYCCKNIKDS